MYAVSKIKLTSLLAPHLIVGILVIMMDLPYDIIGVKFLHWVWHDTDPNIADPHYWAPWTSLYSNLCFGASFSFFSIWQENGLRNEILICGKLDRFTQNYQLL